MLARASPVPSSYRLYVCRGVEQAAATSPMPRIRTIIRRWRRAIRDVGLIVAGVLIALAANAWWQARQDQERARDYITQLLADVRENERTLRSAFELDSTTANGVQRLLSALDRVPAPPRDSLRVWMQRPPVFYSDPRPRLGTVNALIETGDIRLFRDERLRSAVIAYASDMKEEQAEASRAIDVLVPGGLLLARRFRDAGLPTVGPGPDGRFRPAALDRLTDRFVAGWPAIRSDPQVFEGLLNATVGYASRVSSLAAMLDATMRLRRVLESEDAA
jgi:hypothetical protein